MSKTFDTFAHLRFKNGAAATLAIRETTSDDNTALIEIGVSWCSTNDHFSRSKGRAIAIGRLNSKRGYYAVAPRDTKKFLKEQADELLRECITDKVFTRHINGVDVSSTPRWVGRALRGGEGVERMSASG